MDGHLKTASPARKQGDNNIQYGRPISCSISVCCKLMYQHISYIHWIL